MKKKMWYTLEKRHNLWTIWGHWEENNSVNVWGIYTDPDRRKCIKYAKENNIKLGGKE